MCSSLSGKCNRTETCKTNDLQMLTNGVVLAGADIMMQLDDVVPATAVSAERFEEATHRTTRWLDRCLAVHTRPEEQSLFAIVQGGTDSRLRDISLKVSLRD